MVCRLVSWLLPSSCVISFNFQKSIIFLWQDLLHGHPKRGKWHQLPLRQDTTIVACRHTMPSATPSPASLPPLQVPLHPFRVTLHPYRLRRRWGRPGLRRSRCGSWAETTTVWNDWSDHTEPYEKRQRYWDILGHFQILAPKLKKNCWPSPLVQKW